MLRSSVHRPWSCPRTSLPPGNDQRTSLKATPPASSSPPTPTSTRRQHLSQVDKPRTHPRALRDDDCPFDTLGVSPSATDDEIKRAYRLHAKEHHPDVGGATARFLKVAEAYKLLTRKSNDGRGGRRGEGPSPSTSWSFHDFFWSFSAKRRSSWAARKSRQHSGGAFESYDGDEEGGEGGEGSLPSGSKASSHAATKAELRSQLDGLRARAARRRAAESSGETATAARAAAGKQRQRQERASPAPPRRSFYVAEGAAPGDSAICDDGGEREGDDGKDEGGGSDDGHHRSGSDRHRSGSSSPRSSSFVGDSEATRRQLAGLRRKVALRRARAGSARAGSGDGGGGERRDDER